MSIFSQWLLLGRVKPGTVPIWGWFYVRWWVVRLVYKQSMAVLFPLLRNTPLMNALFRALGAKVGRNVTIDTFHVSDWDLLEIGDNVGECCYVLFGGPCGDWFGVLHQHGLRQHRDVQLTVCRHCLSCSCNNWEA